MGGVSGEVHGNGNRDGAGHGGYGSNGTSSVPSKSLTFRNEPAYIYGGTVMVSELN